MAILGSTKVTDLSLLDGVLGNLNPVNTGVYDLGTSSLKWRMLYGNVTGDLTGNASSATKLKNGRTFQIKDADNTNAGTASSAFTGESNLIINLPSTIKATLSGNAATATKFASAQSITLTGDITGTVSSQAGWSINTTLVNSGVTANTYGNTSQQTPSHGGTFNIPYFKVDAKGRVTQAGTTTVKLPADSNTDTKVTQTVKSDNVEYKILTTTSASPSSGSAAEAAYSTDFKINPSTKILTAPHFLVSHANGGGQEYRVTYGDTVDMALMIGSGNINHGLYDDKASKWMIYADDSGNVTVNGKATTAGTADKLGTVNVGNNHRGIYLNAGTPTALSWYPNHVGLDSGNTNNYPWHRIATTNLGTGSYVDKDAIIFIRSRFNGGKYGILKISARADNATTNPKGAVSISATWIVRYGFAETDVRIAKKGLAGESAQCDVYVKCETYMRAIVYLEEGSNNGWTLVASYEVNNTTTSDKKTSVEVYADVSTTVGAITYDIVKDAVDGGNVSYAKTAGSTSGNAATATEFSSNATVKLTGDVTGEASAKKGWTISTTIGSGKVTNAMLAGSITNSKLTNSKVTIAGNDVSLGGSLAADTLRTSLGLSNAMHFIGVATVAITDGSTTDPVISGYSTKTAGDVIIDKDTAYEFVWSGSKWERLGPDGSYKVIQTKITDSTGTAETTTATRFVYSVSQDANGVISVKTRPLPTYNNYSLPAASTSTRGGIKVGSGLSITNTDVLGHSNSVTSKTTFVDTATTASANGGTIKVTDIKYDAYGHITGSQDRTITLSQTTYTLSGLGGVGTISASGTAPLTLSASKSGTTVTISGSIAAASTSAAGVTKLNSATNSTSTTEAATPNAVKSAYDLANNHKYWANVEATSAASYNAAPEMATLKLNGNTSASAASTSNVTLVFDATLQALNFVFA